MTINYLVDVIKNNIRDKALKALSLIFTYSEKIFLIIKYYE
jgi:hypothetical protein